MTKVEFTEKEMVKKSQWEAEFKKRKQVIEKHLTLEPPRGKYYEAEVPDTLDLAERGELTPNSVIGSIEPDRDYLQFRIQNINGQMINKFL